MRTNNLFYRGFRIDFSDCKYTIYNSNWPPFLTLQEAKDKIDFIQDGFRRIQKFNNK